jgi:molecular chaperone DnaK (HSP70)
MDARYAIGIDLGTTNTVIAYIDKTDEKHAIQLFQIPQLTSASTLEQRSSLPSFCYLATDAEAEKGVYGLPWDKKRNFVIGELARKPSADVPARTVTAARSWLAYCKVDRRDAILPWNAPADVRKISPVEASRRYLEYCAAVWNYQFPDAPFKGQEVVLTVPASVDASARELTMEAAQKAGFPADIVLLEEPPAPGYSWLSDAGDNWRSRLKLGDILLICDVGGGTTDFSLIGVDQEQGDLYLKRVAVGNHILVGGDNMDLTIAHYARMMFADKGVQLDAWQSVSLWHACRAAKEQLLSEKHPEKHPVAILGRGSKLIGGTVSVDLVATEVEKLLREGFFPSCQRDARPSRKVVSGFREIGLPFESDTAITRHLAQFLGAHGENGVSVRPTHLLFTGGVFKADAFRSQLLSTVSQWFNNEPVDMLSDNPDYDHAVAKGAAYYAFAKHGKGIRIRGGTARSYYVGIETAGPAVPGFERPLNALCVVPFGMEEGTEADVPGNEIGLVVGEPVKFRFFSSSERTHDAPGDLIPNCSEPQFMETDSLESQLKGSEKFTEGYVPVRFHSRITELGMFELSCNSTVSDDTWKLEFSVRDKKD